MVGLSVSSSPRRTACVLSAINQDLDERAEAYNRLMKDMAAFPVAAAPPQGRKNGAGYVLTLDGEWKQGRLKRFGHTLGFAPERYIVPGMSGSPIVSAAGAAIGIISTGSEESVDAAFDGLIALNPVLLDCLPAWLTKRLAARSPAAAADRGTAAAAVSRRALPSSVDLGLRGTQQLL